MASPSDSLQPIFDCIAGQFPQTVEELTRLCRQPSVSAQNLGMAETVELVAQMLEEAGCRVEVLPTKGPYPAIYGEAVGASPTTLLFYNHYDVQPPEPLELWTSPPFEPQIRDGHFYARGVADNKGDLVARLAALRAFRQVRGQLPISVKFFIEGEEELGSPNLGRLIAEHGHRLQADGCLWEGGDVNWRGQPVIVLGAKGICYVELEVETSNRDVHSSQATVVPNAAWRLLWALASLKDPQEKILIPGFYDEVSPPSPAELEALASIPAEDEELRASLGLTSLLGGVSGRDYFQRHLLEPTCTICGLDSGYSGPGAKTVSPHRARAKLDFRLVPNQRPEDVLAKLRRHLDEQGFSDVRITTAMDGEHPARTDPSSPFVRLVRAAAQRVYQTEPVVMPTMAATGPMYLFTDVVGLPVASSGVSYPDSRLHAPDENIRLNDFLQAIKQVSAIMELMGLGR